MQLINSVLFTVILILAAVENIKCQGRDKAPRSFGQEYSTRQLPAPLIPSFEPDFEHPDCKKCLNERYFQHYLIKGCKPVMDDIFCNKPCPKYFDCPPQPQVKSNSKECYLSGKTYPIGSEVPVPNPCGKCMCTNITSEPQITCAHVDCPEIFGPLNPEVSIPLIKKVTDDIRFPSELPKLPKIPKINIFNKRAAVNDTKNCFLVYAPGQCCALRNECPTDEQLKTMTKCTYDGIEYKRGQMIYPSEDPCLKCLCDEKWNNTDPTKSGGCTRVDCGMELELQKNKGCLPVYHEGTCCPIEYYCPPKKELKCVFDGEYYKIGAKLFTGKDLNNCVTCECRVPPEFTCIQKQCPSPPNETGCVMSFNEDQCCATYKCPSDRTKTNYPMVVTPPQSPCPPKITLHCGSIGFNCTQIPDENGCDKCSCEKLCPNLADCGDGCYLFSINPDECPKCACDNTPQNQQNGTKLS